MVKKLLKTFYVLLVLLALLCIPLACGNPQDEVKNYDVFLPNVTGGSITADVSNIKEGGSVELTISPEKYYELSSLKVNGEEVSVVNNKALIENITEDLNVTASFIGAIVNVSLNVNGEVVGSITPRFAELYGNFPDINIPSDCEFVGWYTEENGAGKLIDSISTVENGEAHVLYAYFTTALLTVEVGSVSERLVHLPGSDAESTAVEVSVFNKDTNVTNDVEIELVSSNTNLIIVDGLTLKISDGADGLAEITVKVNGVEYNKINVYAIDYAGLGYKAIANLGDFKTIDGTSKYVLINDIEVNGWLSKSDYTPLIDTLAAGAVIDGNGHSVVNAKLAGGWNRSWIGYVNGTVKNLSFVNLTCADSNAFSTGLFGFLNDGGLLENIFVDAVIPCDGSIDAANKSGGVLIGTLTGGTIKNVILNANVNKGVSLEGYGSFAGIVDANNNAKVYNSYAIINHTYLREVGNEYKYGSWENSIADNSGVSYNSVHSFINELKGNNGLDDTIWSFTDDNLLFNGEIVLKVEPEISVAIDDNYLFTKDDLNSKVNFTVYLYGEETEDYVITKYKSSDESIFTVDEDGYLTFIKDGTATLTILINDSCEVFTEITIKPDYYLITTVEEFLTLLPSDPGYNFKLGNNIDFNGQYLTGASNYTLLDNFSGVFDGDGYSIMNAVLPGSWAGHSLIGNLSGTFKNISFINLIGTNVCTNSAIISDNKGLIENVYVDFVIRTDGREYGFAGVIAGYAGIGEMRNCITNIRLADELEVAPTFYGSIVGRASNWHGQVINCYSIVHNTGVLDICAEEAADGIINQFKKAGSKQYQTYTQLKGEADVSMYDSSIWRFEDDKIIFGDNVVYTLQEDDYYVYLSTADDFVKQIQNNPSGKFRLAKDIDFNGKAITFEQNNIEFSGEIDGMGYIISNAVMNQNNIFTKNSGKISNIAFVNLTGPSNGEMAGLVKENTGVIDNVFIDFVINSDGQSYDYAGIVAADASSGTISSTIVNLNLADGLTNTPAFYGSLVGKFGENSVITNSYAITNAIDIVDVAVMETSTGLIDLIKDNSCNQYSVYSDITKSGEDYSTFNDNWEFTNAQIRFNDNIVVIDVTQDEYIYISTIEDWYTLIPANPDGKYKLSNDIDFNGAWITNGAHATLTSKFTGELDGCGYALRNGKMPGGWAGHAIFDYNEGYIHNIAFINIIGHTLTTQNALININRGIIENLYVDFVLTTSTYTSTYNGVVATFADNQLSKDKPSEIRNCIVNVRLGDGQTLPPNQGSIVGKAGGWTGYVKNCYAIINDTGIENVCFDSNGTVAASTCSTSAQFETYSLLKANADLSGYDTSIWTFTDTTISFFGNIVYTVEE